MEISQLSDEMIELYKQFRLKSYQELFGKIREKDGTLSATEAFAADVIYLLGVPTIGKFADTLGISQPNATYKANNLLEKGYIGKTVSQDDKRECRLSVADKFFDYFDTKYRFLTRAVETIENSFSAEEILRQHRTIHGTHLACIIFRHIARKSSAIHKVFPRIFRQSDENSDCAICAPELCGVTLSFLKILHQFRTEIE